MATGRANQASGPDAWAIAAGWACLVLGVITLNYWAWTRNYGDAWVLRGGILTLACLVTWLFGYWGKILAGFKDWARRGGLNATAVTVGVLVAAVGVNYLLHRYHWQKDLTQDKRFTLSDRSVQLLKGLKKPVKATAFYYSVGSNRGQATNLLRQYSDASNNFKYQMVDPLENQALADQKKLNTQEGVVFEYEGRTQQASTVTEKDFTQALIKLTREKQPKVYFLQGHGEMAYEAGGAAGEQTQSISQIANLLKDDNWQLQKLTLGGKGATPPDPADAAVVVIAGPKSALMPEEEKLLQGYLAKGGRILALIAPGGPDLSAVLKPYGLEPKNDWLYDPGYRQGMIVCRDADIQSHAVTRRISTIAFLGVRSIHAADKPPTGITAQALVKSGPTSISSPTQLQKLVPGQAGTTPGPFTVAAVGTRTAAAGATGSPESRVIAIGTTLSFSDAFLSAFGAVARNENFLTNCVNWLGDQTELVSIPPKDTAPKSLAVQEQHASLLELIYWLEFPVLAIALGIYVYLKRR